MNTPSAPRIVHTMKLVSKYRNAHTRVGQWPLRRNSLNLTAVLRKRNENASDTNFGAIHAGLQLSVKSAPLAQRELVCVQRADYGFGAGRVIDAGHALAQRAAPMWASIVDREHAPVAESKNR